MSLSDQTLQFFPVSARVSVLQARGLRVKGKDGTNDAYTALQAGRETFRTPVVEKCTEPVWGGDDANFIFTLPAESARGERDGVPLQVRVLHRVPLGADKLLGLAVINVHELRQSSARENPKWFKLLNKAGKADKERGEVLLDIQFLKSSMSVSMIDLSDKSHSRLGKFKDKLRVKKKDGLSDSASAILPSVTQVLTDSEGEMDGETEGEPTKKKKNKLKSLFVPKSNMKRNSLSQSMSSLGTLPDKNSSISSSTSSGLNVESSDGKKKKKFPFLTHKRNGSTDSKASNHSDVTLGSANQNPPSQVEICINGSHVYREETQSEEMQDMEEEEEKEEERWRREEEEQERLKEEQRREVEEERRRKEKEEQRRRKEEEEKERIRMEREKEEQRRKMAEEKERMRMEREKEEERKRLEEEEKDRIRKEREIEEQRRRIEEEEKERIRKEREIEEQRRRIEEKGKERIRKEREIVEQSRRIEEEEKERIRKEREIVEQRRRIEEEEKERIRRERENEEQKRRMEEEEKERIRFEREKEEQRRKMAAEKERIRMEREKEEERKRLEEEENERIKIEREKEEQRKKMADEKEKIRMEREKDEEKRRIKEEEKEKIRIEKEKEEQKRRIAEEEKERLEREKEEKRRKLQEEERIRMKREKEEQTRMLEEERKRKEEKEAEELKRKMEEENDRKKAEEEEKMRIAEVQRMKEEKKRAERERMMVQEEKRIEMERRLADEKKAREEEERRRAEEEKQRKEEERAGEEQERKRVEMEKKRKDKEQEMEEKKKREKQMREEQERNLFEESVISQSTDFTRSARISNVRPSVPISATVSRLTMVNTNPFLDDDLDPSISENISVEDRTAKKGRAPVPPQLKRSDESSRAVSKQNSQLKDVSKRLAPQPPGKEVSAKEFTDPAGLGQEAKKTPERHDESKVSLSIDNTQVDTNPFTCDWPMAIKPNKRPAPKPRSGISVSEDKSRNGSENPTEVMFHLKEKSSASDCKGNPPNLKLLSAPNDITVEDVKSDLTDDLSPKEEHLEDLGEPSPEPPVCKPDGLPSLERSQKKSQAPFPPAKPKRTGDPNPAHKQQSLLNKTSLEQDQENHSNKKDQDNTLISSVEIPAVSRRLSSTDPSPTFSPRVEKSQVIIPCVTESMEKGSGSGSKTFPWAKVVSNDAGEVREQVAPTSIIRQQAVKPLSSAENQPENHEFRVTDNTQPRTKASEAGLKGPYSQLTQPELISLALRQQEQISQRDSRIQELEQYIDNLLLRVMEEKPSILMTLNNKTKLM